MQPKRMHRALRRTAALRINSGHPMPSKDAGAVAATSLENRPVVRDAEPSSSGRSGPGLRMLMPLLKPATSCSALYRKTGSNVRIVTIGFHSIAFPHIH
jgi:hypothetical protein